MIVRQKPGAVEDPLIGKDIRHIQGAPVRRDPARPALVKPQRPLREISHPVVRERAKVQGVPVLIGNPEANDGVHELSRGLGDPAQDLRGLERRGDHLG